MEDSYTIGGKWLNDLGAELTGSDRACAVLAGAILDDRLKILLLGYFLPPINEKEDRLLGRSGALESFSARIELAYRSALVSLEVRRALDWVRDIRNDAAHQQDFQFELNHVKDRVANIASTLRTREKLPPKLLVEFGETSKGSFVANVTLLVFVLEVEAGETVRTSQRPFDLLKKSLRWQDEPA